MGRDTAESGLTFAGGELGGAQFAPVPPALVHARLTPDRSPLNVDLFCVAPRRLCHLPLAPQGGQRARAAHAARVVPPAGHDHRGRAADGVPHRGAGAHRHPPAAGAHQVRVGVGVGGGRRGGGATESFSVLLAARRASCACVPSRCRYRNGGGLAWLSPDEKTREPFDADAEAAWQLAQAYDLCITGRVVGWWASRMPVSQGAECDRSINQSGLLIEQSVGWASD